MGKPSPHPSGGIKLTQQHMEGVTDINKIMERHNRTGVFGSGRPSGKPPQFLNMTGDSFHEMLIKVQEAQGVFAGFPGKIRKRFGNNPENMLRFMEDSSNLREAVALGLVDKEVLTPDQLAQMDLVQVSEEEERRQFEEWRQSRRTGRSAPGIDDPFDLDDDASSVPKNSDPEAQPRFSKKKRTS